MKSTEYNEDDDFCLWNTKSGNILLIVIMHIFRS